VVAVDAGSNNPLARTLVRMYRRRAPLDSVTGEEETAAQSESRTVVATVIVHEPGSLKR
jgi:hypothetical protein